MAFFKTLYEKLAGEKNPSHSKSRREKNIILRLFENIKNIKKKMVQAFFLEIFMNSDPGTGRKLKCIL